MEKQNRTAIVTGASRGIGAAIAARLASDGFGVVVNYGSSAREAAQLAAGIQAAGGKAIAVSADVSDPAAITALFDAAEAEFGHVDVLVNNAGLLKFGAVMDVSDEDFHRLIAVNLTGTFNGLREGARRIRAGGRIVSLSTSIIGAYQTGFGAYAASKAAVEALTHGLAKELGPRGITVNAVAPGPVATELLLANRPPEFAQRLIADIPLGRLGVPDDIARVVSFLAGPDGGWVSGQIVKANGGRNP